MSQTELFPSDQPRTPDDMGDVAARIAANAKPVEHEDRTSEAARDQGWGPQDELAQARSEMYERDIAESRNRHPSAAPIERVIVNPDIPGRETKKDWKLSDAGKAVAIDGLRRARAASHRSHS